MRENTVELRVINRKEISIEDIFTIVQKIQQGRLILFGEFTDFNTNIIGLATKCVEITKDILRLQISTSIKNATLIENSGFKICYYNKEKEILEYYCEAMKDEYSVNTDYYREYYLNELENVNKNRVDNLYYDNIEVNDRHEPIIFVKYHDEKYCSGGEKLERLNKIKIGDFVDLRAAIDIDLEPFEFKLIPLGISVKLPKGYYGQIVPRSSTYKKYGIIQTNSFGVIDESYCGEDDEWLFPALAIRKTHIDKGERICQFTIVKKESFIMQEVPELSDMNRGGIGSTGYK